MRGIRRRSPARFRSRTIPRTALALLWAIAVAGSARADFCPETGPIIAFMPGTRPNAVECGDVNGDNLPELFTANDANNTTSRINNIDGASFGPPLSTLIGIEPLKLAVGDIDADNDRDVVIANRTGGTISLLINDGAGNMSATTGIPGGANLLDVALANLNDDTLPDIALANGVTDEVTVLFNQGGAVFSAPLAIPVGDAPSGLDVCDVNGDLRDDIVVANLGAGTVTVILNMGGGMLVPQPPKNVMVDPNDIACCDIDGINGPDIVVVDLLGSDLAVLTNNGMGSFGVPAVTSLGVTAVPFAITCGDIDADGDPDIFTPNLLTNDVAFIENLDGTLATPVFFPIGENPSYVDICDIDNDNDADLVVAYQGGLRIIDNACTPLLGDMNNSGVVETGDIPGFIAVLLGADTAPARIALADLDQNGTADGNDIAPFIGAIFGG